jgi:hypothetical protein
MGAHKDREAMNENATAEMTRFKKSSDWVDEMGRSHTEWGTGHEGEKKLSLFNVQLSFVVGGGASRNLFLKMPRRRGIRK